MQLKIRDVINISSVEQQLSETLGELSLICNQWGKGDKTDMVENLDHSCLLSSDFVTKRQKKTFFGGTIHVKVSNELG